MKNRINSHAKRIWGILAILHGSQRADELFAPLKLCVRKGYVSARSLLTFPAHEIAEILADAGELDDVVNRLKAAV